MGKKIYLIRHGETPGNLEKRYIGKTDENLSEQGILALNNRCYPQIDKVFSSPLIRCVRTAKIIFPDNDITVIDDFRETDFGRFEGKNYEELKNDSDYIRWLESGGTASFPEGEDPSEVTERVMAGWDELMRRSEGADTVAAVVHGGTIMSLLSVLFGGSFYDYHVENGKGYSFDISSDGVYSGLCARSYNR